MKKEKKKEEEEVEEELEEEEKEEEEEEEEYQIYSTITVIIMKTSLWLAVGFPSDSSRFYCIQ